MFLELITDSMNTLSKSHKRIAHYIIENAAKASYQTAAEIAHFSNTSEATVVRFALRLGFEGFPQFKRALMEYVQKIFNQKADRYIRLSEINNEANLVHDILRKDIENIDSTMNEFNEKLIDQACDMICNARKIYAIGLRSCLPLCEYLCYYLRMIRGDIIPISSVSSSEIMEQIIDIDELDVLIGISFPRYSYRTLKAMEYASVRRAGIISITDSVYSPMNLYSSCNLLAKSSMLLVMDSLVAPMSLINLIITQLLIKNAGQVVKKIELLTDVMQDNPITNNDEINFLDENALKELKQMEK